MPAEDDDTLLMPRRSVPCAFVWREIAAFRRDETTFLTTQGEVEGGELAKNAKRLWSTRTQVYWAALLQRRIGAHSAPPSDAQARAIVAALRRHAHKEAGPVSNTLRTLCGGWSTDARFGRAARSCPWCRAPSGHRLTHLLGCERPDACLRGAGFGWVGLPEEADRLRRMLWCADPGSAPPARLLVAVDAAFYAFHSGGVAPLRDLVQARVRALMRRHPRLASQCSFVAGRVASRRGRARGAR